MRYAEHADYHVMHIPLSDQRSAMFNETAAIQFFTKTQGLPYGLHNFLYSFFDTPDENIPLLIPEKSLPFLGSFMEYVDRNWTDILVGQSFNKRLGTTGLNISEVVNESFQQNMTAYDLMSIPEGEGWEYDGFHKDGESFVCSAYVSAVLKAAGVFGNTYINPQE